MRVALVFLALIDWAIALLLISVSGFLIGAGPESLRGGPWMTVVLFATVICCVIAPVLGYLLIRRDRSGFGLLIAALPPLCGLVALTIPPPY